MSEVRVEPAQLRTAAGSCARGGETAAHARQSLLQQRSVDTGRVDTRAAVATVVDELATALAGLAVALHGDAQALSGAAAAYAMVDGAAVRR